MFAMERASAHFLPGGIFLSTRRKTQKCGRCHSIYTRTLKYCSAWLAAAWLLPGSVGSWNSFDTQSQFYTFQDFYSDAQYGPDFGYYSTGEILHADGPADNGAPEAEAGKAAGQDWFNSYTTLPMLLSPDFAHALCDRIVTMWHALGSPSPFVLVEFGGGTGMLARDILRRGRDSHVNFYNALGKYVIAERSQAMRGAQQHTAAEFIAVGKLQVAAIDAREAALVRPLLDNILDGKPVRGIILSNELLDEMDPVRLRLTWQLHQPPTARQCTDCRSFREAYVIQRIDTLALEKLLEPSQPSFPSSRGIDTRLLAQSIAWEGKTLPCGLLNTPILARAMAEVAEDLTPVERGWCSPMLVCCLPFLLAVNHALQYSATALQIAQLSQRQLGNVTELGMLYRHHLNRTNGTVLLSKNRYRELRRLATASGPEVRNAFLLGGDPSLLPGRVHSEEIFLALSPTRCRELKGWMTRNAQRLASAANLRNHVAWIYNGDAGAGHNAIHLKMVVRPGEAQFVEQTSHVLDHGFMVTLDYGADADALAWQNLVKPNDEGILVMDARSELMEQCTDISYLECPGLQDLTTSVDFTEVAQAGKLLGGWSVLAYGPLFLLELAFAQTPPHLTSNDDPRSLGHLLERAGGLTTTGLQAWYLKPEQDPWASFKILVQHRGEQGRHWSLGPLGREWPLTRTPHLFRSPAQCWNRDLTKPPLAAMIAAQGHVTLEDHIKMVLYSGEDTAPGEIVEAAVRNATLRSFQEILLRDDKPLTFLLQEQHRAQKMAYSHTHLALLLVDYLYFTRPDDACRAVSREQVANDVRMFAMSRRLPELYGQDEFDRVLFDVIELASADSTWDDRSTYPPYICLANQTLRSRCSNEALVKEIKRPGVAFEEFRPVSKSGNASSLILLEDGASDPPSWTDGINLQLADTVNIHKGVVPQFSV